LGVAYGAGNWIGPQTFQANQAPEYKIGKTILATFFGLAIADLFGLRMINHFANKRREKAFADGTAVPAVDGAARDLTDFEQPQFKYML
jgi:hypothetical protein